MGGSSWRWRCISVLVFLAPIEPQAAPNAVELAFTNAPLDEGRRHQRAADAPSKLATQRKRILAAELAVADKT